MLVFSHHPSWDSCVCSASVCRAPVTAWLCQIHPASPGPSGLGGLVAMGGSPTSVHRTDISLTPTLCWVPSNSGTEPALWTPAWCQCSQTSCFQIPKPIWSSHLAPCRTAPASKAPSLPSSASPCPSLALENCYVCWGEKLALTEFSSRS